MSVTDPLIKELKGHTHKLLESPKPLTDDDGKVSALCECLERIFYSGLLPFKNALGLIRKAECWYWLERVANEKSGTSYQFVSCIEDAKKCVKVSTHRGKTRQFFRCALVKRCLHVPVQTVINQKIAYLYYDRYSILGDEILSELLLSVLMMLGRLEFKLDTKNARFLDESWAIPRALDLIFVPCTQLGINLVFVNGKALVLNVLANSVAEENENLEIGDIVDELNGCCINESAQGGLSGIMRKSLGRPVTVYLIKAEWHGRIFPPLVPLLKQVGLDPTIIASRNSPSTLMRLMPPEVQIYYLGEIDAGDRGDMKRIKWAIDRIITAGHQREERVQLQFFDLGIHVLDYTTHEVIMSHSFVDIASCASTTSVPHYFAYMTVDADEGDPKRYKCQIFQCDNTSEVELLLQNLGQGFNRTRCAA